jgi:hypothetical protein
MLASLAHCRRRLHDIDSRRAVRCLDLITANLAEGRASHSTTTTSPSMPSHVPSHRRPRPVAARPCSPTDSPTPRPDSPTRCPTRLCDNFFYSFKGTPSARQAVRPLTPVRPRSREIIGELRELARGQSQSQADDGNAPTAGRAACRALTGGTLRARRRPQASRPAPAGRRSRRNAPDDCDRANWPRRPPRAGHCPAVQRSPSRARLRHVLRIAQAPP